MLYFAYGLGTSQIVRFVGVLFLIIQLEHLPTVGEKQFVIFFIELAFRMLLFQFQPEGLRREIDGMVRDLPNRIVDQLVLFVKNGPPKVKIRGIGR